MPTLASNKPNNTTASNLFLAIIFVSLVLSLILSGLSSMGVDLNNFWVNIAATVARYLVYLGLFFVFVRLCNLGDGKWKSELLMNKKPKPVGCVISCVIAIVSIAGFLLLTAAVMQLFKVMGFEPSGALAIDGWGQYIACVIVIGIIPAVIEELIFRGLILRGLEDNGTQRAVIISALLFMLFHLNPAQTVYQFVLGLVLAGVVLISGNLFYGMIVHFANNFAIITYTFITGDPELLISLDFVWLAAIVGLAVLATAVLYGLARALKNDFVFKKPKKKLFTRDNQALFFAIAISMLIWISVFVGV